MLVPWKKHPVKWLAFGREQLQIKKERKKTMPNALACADVMSKALSPLYRVVGIRKGNRS